MAVDPNQATPAVAWMFLAPSQSALQLAGDQSQSTVTAPPPPLPVVGTAVYAPTSAATSFTLTIPAAEQAGDLILIHTATPGPGTTSISGTFGTPSPGNGSTDATNLSTRSWYLANASASEAGRTVTFTTTQPARVCAAIVVLRGVTAAALSAIAYGGVSTGTASATGGGNALIDAGCYTLQFAASANSTAVTSWTPPPGMTVAATAYDGASSGGSSLAIGYDISTNLDAIAAANRAVSNSSRTPARTWTAVGGTPLAVAADEFIVIATFTAAPQATGAATAFGSTVSYNGTATAPATGATTAAGTAAGTASPAATGTTTAAGAGTSGPAQTGIGTVTTTAVLGTTSGATPAGTGSATAGGTATGAATPSATGTAAAVGTVGLYGGAALTGTGIAGAAGPAGIFGTAAPAGTGTVTAAGSGVGPATNATATGTAAAAGAAAGQVAAAGVGSVAAAGVIGGGITATTAGTGTASAVGQVAATAYTAPVGVGQVAAAGYILGQSAATPTGVGLVGASGQVVVTASAAAAGTGATTPASSVTVTQLAQAVGASSASGYVGTTNTAAATAAATATATGVVLPAGYPPYSGILRPGYGATARLAWTAHLRGGMTAQRIYGSISTETVAVDITSRLGLTLGGAPVYLALIPARGNLQPASGDWKAATWASTGVTATATFQVGLTGNTYPTGVYVPWYSTGGVQRPADSGLIEIL